VRRLCAGSLVACVLAAGCGSPPPDLFAVGRSGAIPGGRLRIVVSDDGTVRCNGGARRDMSGSQLLFARQLARDLHDSAANGLRLRPGPNTVLSYDVEVSAGRIRFSDTSPGLVPALLRLEGFTRRLSVSVCGLRH